MKTNIKVVKKFLWLPTRIGKHMYWLTNYVKLMVKDRNGDYVIGCEYIEDNGNFIEEGLR